MLIAFGSVYDERPMDNPASMAGVASVKVSCSAEINVSQCSVEASGTVRVSAASNNVLMVDPDKVLLQ